MGLLLNGKTGPRFLGRAGNPTTCLTRGVQSATRQSEGALQEVLTGVAGAFLINE